MSNVFMSSNKGFYKSYLSKGISWLRKHEMAHQQPIKILCITHTDNDGWFSAGAIAWGIYRLSDALRFRNHMYFSPRDNSVSVFGHFFTETAEDETMVTSVRSSEYPDIIFDTNTWCWKICYEDYFGPTNKFVLEEHFHDTNYCRDWFNFDVVTTNYVPDWNTLEKKIKWADEVWVTDLNLSLDNLHKMVDMNRFANWFYVDHHGRMENGKEWSEEEVTQLNFFDAYCYAPSDRDSGESAAYYTYGIIAEFLGRPTRCQCIDAVSGRDVWKLTDKEYYDTAKYAIDNINCSPNTIEGLVNMIDLISDDYHFSEQYKNGVLLKKFQERSWKRTLAALGTEVTLIHNDKEYSCIAMTHFVPSDAFGDALDKYDFGAKVVMKPTRGEPGKIFFEISLFSRTQNCREVCLARGGGGHEGVAGYQTTKFPIMEVNGRQMLLSQAEIEIIEAVYV